MSDNFCKEEKGLKAKIKIDEWYNIIDSYNLELNDYTEALFTSGLDKSDIRPLEQVIKSLTQLEYQIKEEIREAIYERSCSNARYIY